MVRSVAQRALICLTVLWVTSACRDQPRTSGDILPGESTTHVTRVISSAMESADILFVVDNSPRMADKQALLHDAIPAMVSQLLWPPCFDDHGEEYPNRGECPEGTYSRGTSLESVNIGLLTTSLGGHGSNSCPRGTPGRHHDDRARLVPSMRPNAPDPDGTGFLKWSKNANDDPGVLLANLQDQFLAIGYDGCEYPAPLEAWYRFLVDPTPPEEITRNSFGNSDAKRGPDGNILVDQVVLAQREEFLRPQSTLLIVVLTDQDDCSVMDGGTHLTNARLGHLALQSDFQFPKASPVCETNPNDACCFSCLDKERYEPICDTSFCESSEHLTGAADRLSLRCSQMRERFGIDLLYPTSRYLEALTLPQITDHRTGETVDNPILRGTGKHAGIPRNPDLIFFSGITGVPWQTIATDNALTDPNEAQLRGPTELSVLDVSVGDRQVDRWELLLGNPHLPSNGPRCDEEPAHIDCGKAPEQPLDPFMRLSVTERPSGLVHPISGDVIIGSSSDDPLANNINGHEVNHALSIPSLYPEGEPAADELQTSCIFPLDPPRYCEGASDCVCAEVPSRGRAVCQAPWGGPANTIQFFASATPAPRILTVLRDFGPNALPGSICPKVLNQHPRHSSFGFNTVLLPLLRGTQADDSRHPICVSQDLYPDESGQVDCLVIEAASPLEEGVLSSCGEEGREEVSPETMTWALNELRETNSCGKASPNTCDEYRICALKQLQGSALSACQFEEKSNAAFDSPGFCYIDDTTRPVGDDHDTKSALLRSCPGTSPGALRIVGEETPRPNSSTFIVCQESKLYSTADYPGPRDPFPWDVDQTKEPRGDIPPPPVSPW